MPNNPMRFLPTVTLCACAVLLAGCGGPKPIKLSFFDYSDPAGKFTVRMPATPEPKEEKTANPYGPGAIGSYTAAVDSAKFIVDYVEYPAEYARDQGLQLLEWGLTSYRRDGANHISPSMPVETATYPTRQYEVQKSLDQPPGVLKGRLVLVNNRLYDIVVDHQPGTVAPEDITQFLDSFKPNP